MLTDFKSTSDFLQKFVVLDEQLYSICSNHFYGCGPLDGACYELARALHPHIVGSKLHVICDQTDVEQHYTIGVYFGRVLYMLDADGISTTTDLLNRWKFEELITSPHIIEIECVHRHVRQYSNDQSHQSKILIDKLSTYFDQCSIQLNGGII